MHPPIHGTYGWHHGYLTVELYDKRTLKPQRVIAVLAGRLLLHQQVHTLTTFTVIYNVNLKH